MTKRVKRIGVILAVAIASLVLAFGAHTAYASARSGECDPGDPGYVGECPPWIGSECNQYCESAFQTVGNNCFGGCCICAYR